MNSRTHMALVLAAVLLGTGQRMLAQTPTAQSKSQGNEPVNGHVKGPRLKKMKNTERWAAAIRNADRRADEIRKNHGKGKQ